MTYNLSVETAVVPIVRTSPSVPIAEVLGTGFFVGTDSVLHVITAKHVFADNPLADGERYGIVFRGSRGIAALAIGRVTAAVDFDLAACAVPMEYLSEAVPLRVANTDVALNQDVFSFEYSATRFERTATGRHVSFEPYAHKGNIVRSYLSTYPESIPTPSLLTSFPALQGASGAPILAATSSPKGFVVAGMTVANLERHLIPAQILSVHGEDGEHEEIRYFLPFGKALARSVIVQCLTGLSVPFLFSKDGSGGAGTTT